MDIVVDRMLRDFCEDTAARAAAGDKECIAMLERGDLDHYMKFAAHIKENGQDWMQSNYMSNGGICMFSITYASMQDKQYVCPGENLSESEFELKVRDKRCYILRYNEKPIGTMV